MTDHPGSPTPLRSEPQAVLACREYLHEEARDSGWVEPARFIGAAILSLREMIGEHGQTPHAVQREESADTGGATIIQFPRRPATASP